MGSDQVWNFNIFSSDSIGGKLGSYIILGLKLGPNSSQLEINITQPTLILNRLIKGWDSPAQFSVLHLVNSGFGHGYFGFRVLVGHLTLINRKVGYFAIGLGGQCNPAYSHPQI